MESNINETKDTMHSYVTPLMKLKVKNFIFPIKPLWQALK